MATPMDGSSWHGVEADSWDELVCDPDLHGCGSRSLAAAAVSGPSDDELLAPAGEQEVWAAGVTYYGSCNARMEESKTAGGGSFYNRVYDAERPELFFKATPRRVAGPGGAVRIRSDADDGDRHCSGRQLQPSAWGRAIEITIQGI